MSQLVSPPIDELDVQLHSFLGLLIHHHFLHLLRLKNHWFTMSQAHKHSVPDSLVKGCVVLLIRFGWDYVACPAMASAIVSVSMDIMIA